MARASSLRRLPATRPVRAARSDNRLPEVLAQAARAFRAKGYDAASIRDIVGAIDMLPGSLYYHFPSKEALLLAVYAEGVRRFSEAVSAAIAASAAPWARLEAACIAHLETLLQESDFAQVVVRVRPSDVPAIAAQLVALRDGYEALFTRLVQALPLARGVDRRSLRLMLLGALNWSQTWYRGGRDDPRSIARQFVALLRQQLDSERRS
ncbi:MAG: TetR/AcrR family transcriptional regulator [Betaproteobacteria bacterium]|nr:MAG: TetR/AcrR family transcriptional regulator [Betaproteobacteria bacterium]